MKENAIMPDTDTLLADVSAVVVAVICSDSCGCDRCWSDSSSSWLLNWSRWSTVHFHKWPRNTCINVAAPPITTTGIAVTVDVCRADEWFIWVSVVVDSYKENSCLNHRLLTRAGGCRHFQKIVDNLKPLKFPWYTYKHIFNMHNEWVLMTMSTWQTYIDDSVEKGCVSGRSEAGTDPLVAV